MDPDGAAVELPDDEVDPFDGNGSDNGAKMIGGSSIAAGTSWPPGIAAAGSGGEASSMSSLSAVPRPASPLPPGRVAIAGVIAAAVVAVVLNIDARGGSMELPEACASIGRLSRAVGATPGETDVATGATSAGSDASNG